jgi:putative transposase
MLTAFVQALMNADARWRRVRQPQPRSHQPPRRDPYRWDTRAGTIELAIPKLREGSYVPHWLLERRKAELISVLATSYLIGVSIRHLEKLVDKLGITWDLVRAGSGRTGHAPPRSRAGRTIRRT